MKIAKNPELIPVISHEYMSFNARNVSMIEEPLTFFSAVQETTDLCVVLGERVHSTYAAMGGGGVWPLSTRLYKGGGGVWPLRMYAFYRPHFPIFL